MHTRHRISINGFTVVEVLVVIAVLSILVTLTVPAIQAVREAARRSQCSNNLKQFGLAFQLYESHFGAFPAGCRLRVTGPLATDPEIQAENFMVGLLPFLEQDALYSQYRRDKFFNASANASVIATPLAIAICPSAPGRDEAPEDDFVPSILAPGPLKSIIGPSLATLDAKYGGKYRGAATDYSVPMHADLNLARASGYDISDRIEGLRSMFPLPKTSVFVNNALSLLLSREAVSLGDGLKVAEVTDGLSNTFMMTEVAGRPERWQRGMHTQKGEPLRCAWAHPFIFFSVQPAASQAGDCLINCDNDGNIYSFHPGGAAFLFADGHVDFISDGIEPKRLLSLMTPDQSDNGSE